jgi:hypothetical protein
VSPIRGQRPREKAVLAQHKTVAEEDVATLAELPGWTVHGAVATYRLNDDSWVARVRRVTVFGKAHHASFVSIIDPTGTARYTVSARLLGYARQVAEGQVRTRSTSG